VSKHNPRKGPTLARSPGTRARPVLGKTRFHSRWRIDFDYWDELDDDARAWLAKFVSEYYREAFDDKPLHNAEQRRYQKSAATAEPTSLRNRSKTYKTAPTVSRNGSTPILGPYSTTVTIRQTIGINEQKGSNPIVVIGLPVSGVHNLPLPSGVANWSKQMTVENMTPLEMATNSLNVANNTLIFLNRTVLSPSEAKAHNESLKFLVGVRDSAKAQVDTIIAGENKAAAASTAPKTVRRKAKTKTKTKRK
jgi:hypothetical protein